MSQNTFDDARNAHLQARMAFLDTVKKHLFDRDKFTVPEEEVYSIAPFGTEFREWMNPFGVDAKHNEERREWTFTRARGIGEVRQGDAVAITLLNSSGQPEEFSGQVHQVVIAGDGSKSYVVVCPFQIGADHIRVIVPVEDLEQ